jgi:glucose 1-dehydrogenase
MNQPDLTGKRALVTGANSGIGAAIAAALAAAGARVAVNYVVHPDAAEQVVAAIRDGGGEAAAIRADVTKPGEIDAMFAWLDQTFGGIDILINSAGIDGPRELSWDADLAEWRRVIEVNLFGAFQCSRAALGRMVAQRGGVILSLTSVHEAIPWTGYSAYTASKAALSMLTKTLSQEAAPHGVRVLALAPGAIQTPINQSVWKDPKSREDLIEKIPMGRIGDRDEVAAMAAVLVSDTASYVTGTTVIVDGGMTNYASFSHGG